MSHHVLSNADCRTTPRYVLGIDIDPQALKIAQENLQEAEIESEIDFVLADVAELNNNSALLERLKCEHRLMLGQAIDGLKPCSVRSGRLRQRPLEPSLRHQDQRDRYGLFGGCYQGVQPSWSYEDLG